MSGHYWGGKSRRIDTRSENCDIVPSIFAAMLYVIGVGIGGVHPLIATLVSCVLIVGMILAIRGTKPAPATIHGDS